MAIKMDVRITGLTAGQTKEMIDRYFGLVDLPPASKGAIDYEDAEGVRIVIGVHPDTTFDMLVNEMMGDSFDGET